MIKIISQKISFFFGVCRPFRPSRYTSNSPAYPIQRSYFPIWSSIQCLHVFFYHIFPPQPRSPLWSFTNRFLVHGHPYYVLASHSVSSPLNSSVSNCVYYIIFFEYSSSLFFLILHSTVSLSFTGPKIFLSYTSSFLSSFFLNV